MFYQEKNDYGVLTIDESFITQPIKELIKSFDGKVYLANYKGKQHDILIKLGNFDSISQIDYKITDKGVYIKVYIVTQFGVSIGTFANRIIRSVYNMIADDLELPIDDIIVELTGVISSKGIGKRKSDFCYKGNANR